MSSYKDLLAQREKLEKQIEEAKSREYAEVLSDVKQKIADYGFTLAELVSVVAKLEKRGDPALASRRNTAIRNPAQPGRAAGSLLAGSPARIANNSRSERNPPAKHQRPHPFEGYVAFGVLKVGRGLGICHKNVMFSGK